MQEHFLETAQHELAKARNLEPATACWPQVRRHFGSTATAVATANRHAEELPLVGGWIMEETLWSCTTCRACMEACPVFIEHVPKITDMRRYLVMQESRFPAELRASSATSNRTATPGSSAQPARSLGRRAGRADVADMDAQAETENRPLFAPAAECSTGTCEPAVCWKCSTGSAAWARSMRATRGSRRRWRAYSGGGRQVRHPGQRRVVLRRPARRPGNEYLFQMLAQANIEMMNTYGVRKVITACPHCFNTIKNEYPQLGGNYEVVHHTEFIDYLIKEGRITAGAQRSSRRSPTTTPATWAATTTSTTRRATCWRRYRAWN